MFIFHGPEIQNESRKRPQLAVAGLPSQGPCRRQLLQGKQQPYAVGPGPALAPSHVSPDYKQPSSEAAGRDTSPAAPGKCRLAGKIVQMAQNPRTAFHRNTKTRVGRRAGTGQAPCPGRQNLPLYSSDPDAESSELGGVLASCSSESSLRLLLFLLLFSPEELSSLDTHSLLLKLSLSCLDQDFDDEPREGVEFLSIFTLTFFFFLDFSLLEDSPRLPRNRFLNSSSLIAEEFT